MSNITDNIAAQYRKILVELGENADREGLLETPKRVAKSLQFLTQGHGIDPAAILKSAMFRDEYKQMVVVKDIEIYSLCEHHMLIFISEHSRFQYCGRINAVS